jgi:transposase
VLADRGYFSGDAILAGDQAGILNAIFSVLRGGIAWRLISKNLPPRSTTYGSFSRWRDEGLFGRINHYLVMSGRERVGREASPSAAVPDSCSRRLWTDPEAILASAQAFLYAAAAMILVRRLGRGS